MLDSKQIQKFQNQAQMLSNKVKKRYKHLKKRYKKENIDIFRLYDWDIPEIRVVVDWYGGHLVIGEYARSQSIPEWLPMMGEAVAKAMDVPMAKVHLKVRYAGLQEGKRYERIDHTNQKIILSERDLKFYINPNDYVDTGLFSDHRNTRQMVREIAEGKEFLNLYCYTGSFSCYAAKGGALRTVSVDRSKTAIEWVQENMILNGIALETNILIQAHTLDYLKRAKIEGESFDLAVVDPPSYSTSRNMRHHFDVLKDHPKLLEGVGALMKKGGTVFFSTNHQNFELDMKTVNRIGFEQIHEITEKTIPEDYRTPKKKIHRCWTMVMA